MREVSPLKSKESKRIRIPLHLRSEKGQMAIFVALIFQVLFVFFAMAINVGLVVHDKINLQNSVDLAAYYAAQRQAQWLNVIAHQNYQIRQSFKVFAWRYRILGLLGRTSHPTLSNAAVTEDVYDQASKPTFCISYKESLVDASGQDNLCANNSFYVERVKLPGGFGPINAALAVYTDQMNQSIAGTCSNYGGMNYLYANYMRYAFQIDQYRLKQNILGIGRNLGKPFNQMIDLDGAAVEEGARKTFLKNLTWENAETVEDFNIVNSLEGNFSNPENWLTEIKVRTQTLYRDFSTANGCQDVGKVTSDYPAESGSRNFVEGFMRLSGAQVQQAFAEPNPSDLKRLSLGFEKNPWVKLWVKVSAKTKPRQIFFPFGKAITVTATAYAQPFGGTIGPWYLDTWSKGAMGSDVGNQIDPLAPPRTIDGNGGIPPDADDKLLPNYARFPGDYLGLKTKLAQKILKPIELRASIAAIGSAAKYGPTEDNDPLSWAAGGGPSNMDPVITVRKYEIAAAAPDLFDIAFYSIMPNYSSSVLPKLLAVYDKLGVQPSDKPRPDLGGRASVPQLATFSVEDQMAVASGLIEYPGENAKFLFQNPEHFWTVRNKAHLLTGWVNNKAIAEYSFPKERFGNCDLWDKEFKNKIPGGCVFNGGRSGYSVKLVSGDFLRSPIRLGGAKAGEEQIINFPDF